MKKNALLLCLLIASFNAATAQNFTRLWVNKFADTSASWHTNDIAVDAAGNAYITGYFARHADAYYQTHLFLMKINASGNQDWIRYFSNALDSIDVGTAVTTDSSGYIYITGSRVDTFCNICTVNSKISDVITMKYDAAGNRIWLNRYHDSIYVLASPQGITIQANGALCIVGNEKRYNFTTNQYSSNLLLQKISTNGNTAWTRKHDKAVGNAVCFDKYNNIIVAGASDPSYDYQLQKPAIFKYNAAGAFQYNTVFDEKSKNGKFYFVACDSMNNIFANGQTDTLAFYNNPQILTAKYTAAGAEIWHRKEQNHSTTLPNVYGGFAIDKAGNSYITGYIDKTNVDEDWITTKYNTNGTRQWLQQFDGPQHAYDVPADIAVDKKGNAYVTGYTYGSGGYYKYATIGYTSSGAQIGIDYYANGPRSNNFAEAIAVDNTGNVLVTGITTNSLATIKYGKKQVPIAAAKEGTGNSISMYPNPAKDKITVLYTTTSGVQNADCFITDMYGNVLLQQRLPLVNGTGNTSFTVQALHTGIYIIKVKDGTAFISKSFLKE